MLCGATFGLTTYRHRLFECSFAIGQTTHPDHTARPARLGRAGEPGDYVSIGGHFESLDIARAAMGISWMNQAELSEAIPPAYTALIGRAAATALRYELPGEIVTLSDARKAAAKARANAQAAERMRRYRARQRGENVPGRKPGPKPGKGATTATRLRYMAAELADARAELAQARTRA
jgi:hypothetical protein